jgi:hypothetical protein
MNGYAPQVTIKARSDYVSMGDSFPKIRDATQGHLARSRTQTTRMQSLKWLELSVNPIQRWANLFSQLLPKVNE